jgi:dTDP-4-dehydro-6-deoxy-alpha-D-glucopyranose 2,3-dehydratase
MDRGAGAGLLRREDDTLSERLTRSAAGGGEQTSDAEVYAWVEASNRRHRHTVTQVPFDALRSWAFDPATGDLRHESGRFFSIEGLRVATDQGPVGSWSQPVINQPEIGILGIAVREFDGVLHFLMQAKSEPGNVNGVQISPTVQATRSNYMRVHSGKTVPYLDLFRDTPPERVVSDVLQSEQGAWFFQKRNRNMIVEVTEDIPPHEDFRWLTLSQLHRLMHVDNLINMDARTVLSCVPVGAERTAPEIDDDDRTELGDAVERSSDHDNGGLHAPVEVLSWITDQQARRQVRASLCTLDEVENWSRDEHRISHELGIFFDDVGVDITTEGREVASWSQPLLAPIGEGLVALLVTRVDGVLHALMNARVEPGYLNVVELAPTLQCVPATYDVLAPESRPPFLDLVRQRSPEQVLFSAEMSEEGGRFLHARNRYEIVEVDPELVAIDLPDYRWLTLAQLTELLRHSHYVNVQARSLIACLRGLR